jgi:hypothetical protein
VLDANGNPAFSQDLAILYYRIRTISSVTDYMEESKDETEIDAQEWIETLELYLGQLIRGLETFVGNQAEGDLIYQAYRIAHDINVENATKEDLITLIKDIKPLRWLIHEDDFPT